MVETILAAIAGATLVLVVAKHIATMGRLIERIDTLVARVDSETVQCRAANKELHERIDELYTPR